MNRYLIVIGILVFVIIYLLSTKCSIKSNGEYEGYDSGSASNSLLSSDTSGNIRVLSYPAFPKGVIMLWNGSVASIPVGWSLCDGSNGTPDLRGRFVVGASTTAGSGLTLRNVNDKGGEEAHTLSVDEMPAHSHGGINGNSCSGGSCPAFGGSGYTYRDASTTATGGSKAHNTMPPFYALCYICYTG